jgi:1-phosphofructokinase
LIPIAKKAGAEVVCDFEGQRFRCFKLSTTFVKPNNHELADIFGVELNGLADIEK